MSSVTGPNELSLAELNELPEPAARRVLASCCSAGSWVDAIVSGRGYSSVDRLLAQSDKAVAGLTPSQLGDALAGHPRIGDRRAASAPGWSAQEQAGVFAGDAAAESGSAGFGSAGFGSAGSGSAGSGSARAAADDGLAAALAEGNAEYERRFGHIYLVCATGKSGQELLAILHERLGNDRDTEWKVVAAELAKINQIRLRKLLGAQP